MILTLRRLAVSRSCVTPWASLRTIAVGDCVFGVSFLVLALFRDTRASIPRWCHVQTSPTLTPAPAIRALSSNTTDMVTEQESRSPLLSWTPRLRPSAAGQLLTSCAENIEVCRRHETHDRQDRVPAPTRRGRQRRRTRSRRLSC